MNQLVYNSQYQNLHMDRANAKAMFTVNININSNLASSETPRLIYQYAHGYNYSPQFWGLWDIKYSSGLSNVTRRGYGYITHNTGFGLTASFYYVVDSTFVKLYFLHNSAVTPKPSTAGTKATFTGYLFANDRTKQDYT